MQQLRRVRHVVLYSFTLWARGNTRPAQPGVARST
jgi:hypothetical protein